MLKDADVFLVGGQSNAAGSGDPTEAPHVPDGAGFEYLTDEDKLVPLAEPVGPGEKGSPWSAFTRTYHELTDTPVIIVSKPAGGAAQHSAADLGGGHWQANEDHSVEAANAMGQCLELLDREDIAGTFGGILWHQGESDAIAIEERTIAASDYEDAFEGMLAWFREVFDIPTLALFLFKLGRRRSGDTEGFSAIRAAQDDLAERDPHVHVVYDGATSFAEGGRMHDDLHYTQAGYNEMGEEGARSVASIVTGR